MAGRIMVWYISLVLGTLPPHVNNLIQPSVISNASILFLTVYK